MQLKFRITLTQDYGDFYLRPLCVGSQAFIDSKQTMLGASTRRTKTPFNGMINIYTGMVQISPRFKMLGRDIVSGRVHPSPSNWSSES